MSDPIIAVITDNTAVVKTATVGNPVGVTPTELADLSATGADAGDVLTADGNGGAAWTAHSTTVDVDDVTTNNGSATNYVRVKSGGGLEYRDAASVVGDIGAAASAHAHAADTLQSRPSLGGNAAAASTVLTADGNGASSWAAITAAMMNEWVIVKTADETLTNADFSTPNHRTRASVTTFGNDLDLVLTVDARSIYILTYQFIIGTWGGTDLIKGQILVPSVMMSQPAFGNGYGQTISTAGLSRIDYSTLAFPMPAVTSANTGIRAWAGQVMIGTGASGGTLAFQWAKAASTADQNCSILKNSWMHLKKVGTNYP